MNKIIKYSGAFALALAIVSCNEKIETYLPDAGDYITVTSETDSQVKAGYEGISVLPETFHMDINTPYFSGTMTREGESNKYEFPTDKRLTWGDTDINNVTIKAITQPSGYNRQTGAMTVQSNQKSDANVQASDLLGAVTGYGVTINKNNINISFKHLMSKMYVTYSGASNVVVTSINLKNICRSGVYSYNDFSYTPGTDRGVINMFLNSNDKCAEAIFFPYTPSSSSAPKLEVTADIDGTSKTFDCEISLSKVSSFAGGKRYIMNIVISGSNIEGAEVTVKDWNMDTSTIQVPGQRVLWVGTSIPAGDLNSGIRSYPYLVDDAMNCSVVNNAVAGSLVIRSVQKVINYNKATWDNYTGDGYSTPHLVFGGLAQTHALIEKYSTDLNTVYMAETPDPGAEPKVRNKPNPNSYWGGTNSTQYKNDLAAYEAEVLAHAEWQVKYDARQEALATVDAWVSKHIGKLKELSYESRIIPYINGKKDNCTTVIIDHGFNDRAALIYEAIGYGEEGEIVPGYNYLMKIKAGTVTYEQYLNNLNQWENLTLNGNYIVDMTNIINAIKEANPNVKIIIGNYFTLNCPFITREYTWTATNPDLLSTTYMNYGNLLCYYNEAVAGVNKLDIVNVYEYLRLDEDRYWNFRYDEWKAAYDSTPQDLKAGISPLGYINTDWTKFCPDGVHPFNVDALKTIAEIYIRELDGIIGSRN